jgi:hypothetical protein
MHTMRGRIGCSCVSDGSTYKIKFVTFIHVLKVGRVKDGVAGD